MPPVRRNQQSVSPVAIPSLYHNSDISPSGLQLSLLSLAPTPPDTDGTPSPPAKKKRSHGKARPPGHIPRPPNAFIIFRTEYIRAMVKQNSTPEVSKNLGEMWRNMTPSEKRPYLQKAEEAKIMHQVQNPGYKYKPIHRRDEFGNCIRKPRSPNRPRVKKTPHGGDMLDNLSGSFQWLEGKRDIEFPNAALPSDTSTVSSPPPSPSPAPSLPTSLPTSSYLFHRRSSSVPLSGPDDSFFFGTAPGSAYPSSSTGFHTGHVSRRLSKRPSTSMDFMCAGLGHSEPYGFASGTETHLFPNDPSLWRSGHRRSISAPDFGSEIPTNFTFPSHSVPQEANPLTPINPVFGNVFDRFSWNTVRSEFAPAFPVHASNHSLAQPQTSYPSPQNAQGDVATIQSFATMSHKQQEYITVQIPTTSTHAQAACNFSDATSPPVSTPSSQLPSTPAILHPAPVATFDFSAFEAQITQFELDAAASQGSYEAPLGVVTQPCLPDAGVVYTADEQFFVHGGNDHTTAATAQGTATQPSSDLSTLPPGPAASHDADLQAYQEGVRYTRRRPEITPPRVLDFNELIVDGY